MPPRRDPLTIALDELHDAAWHAFQAELHLYRLVYDIRATHGASWELIGRALGISRQAAHKRFRTPPPGQLV